MDASKSVPIRQRGRVEFVRVREIPRPWRAWFLRFARPFPVPSIRDAGQLVYAVEWENWLYGGPAYRGRVCRRQVRFRHWEACAILRGLDGYGFRVREKGGGICG